MPRSLVLSNSRLMLAYDARYRVRELFWPTVGVSNHLCGQILRTGLWTQGRFSWLEDDAWRRELRFRPGTLVAETRHIHEEFGIELETVEFVPPDADRLIRRLRVRGPAGREVRLFFAQHLSIAESDIGNTALYHPPTDSVVHFKGPYAFSFLARTGGAGLFQYACGMRFGTMEGTWRDAEDGALSLNPIAQGSVDSCLSISMMPDASGEATATFELRCAPDLDTLFALPEWEGTFPAPQPLDTFTALPPRVRDVADQCVPFMLSQIDSGGAILAANDSDVMVENRANYSYCWPRDGALSAEVLFEAGQTETARRFFEFCRPLLRPERPFFLQKYRSDGNLGATWHPWLRGTPLQQDETALTLRGVLRCFGSDPAWETFAQAMADFLVSYRDPASGLPLPSYDLWEERYGVHLFTVAATVAALDEASRIWPERPYADAASAMRDALQTRLFCDKRQAFFRRLDEHGEPDRTLDAASLQVGLLGALPMTDPQVRANLQSVERGLWVRSPIGGLARCEGDYYARVSEAYPGSPWIITTLWLAQSKIALASSEEALEKGLELLEWAARHAEPSGALPEQIHPETGQSLTVGPLTWSHAEFLRTARAYLAQRAILAGHLAEA